MMHMGDAAVVGSSRADAVAVGNGQRKRPVDVALREHLLNRFGYGGSPIQRADYDQAPDRWIGNQIDACANTTGTASQPWTKSPADYQDEVQGVGDIADGRDGMVRELLVRSILEEPSLAHVLRDHWFNHFNVFSLMGIPKHQLDGYINDAIMPSIVGNFSEMLLGTMKHPSMLHYLNNKRNHKTDTTFTFVRDDIGDEEFNDATLSVGPNENYAREVLELHTVGADNHSQLDVTEAARVLSGVSDNGYPRNHSAYVWRQDWHDTNSKLVLNHTFAADGDEQEITEFAEMLATNQHTANRVGAKLAQRFVGPTANPTTINGVSLIFHLATKAEHLHNDIALAMRQVANTPQMVDPATFRSKYKPPHRFVISAYRSVGAVPNNDTLDFIVDELALLGDSPFFFGPPTGYPDADGFWLTGDGLLGRAQIARAIANDLAVLKPLAKSTTDLPKNELIAALISAFLPAGASPQTEAVVGNSMSLAVGHADRVRAAIEVVLSSPEFLEY